MIAFPNAKINIGLNITEKRNDGFHNLETIFYPVKWSDVLEIIPSSVQTSFQSTGIDIPGDEQGNLCLKAYHLLNADFNIGSVSIHLHKLIPIGAGLGGGSADASFTIKSLNTLFDLKLSKEQMESYARKLGSDCAFFIKNTPVFAYNKGDTFKEIQLDLSAYHIALVKPTVHISTADAYNGVKPNKPFQSLSKLIQLPIENWKHTIVNDFEQSVFQKYPEIALIKQQLYNAGAVYASMSGSGSCLYGIFKEKPKLQFNNCLVKLT
jgi:4-diphosphocytidyl-2-C-methyl-D-erythritol kinase